MIKRSYEMVEQVFGLHRECFDSNKEKSQGSEVSNGASKHESEGGGASNGASS